MRADSWIYELPLKDSTRVMLYLEALAAERSQKKIFRLPTDNKTLLKQAKVHPLTSVRFDRSQTTAFQNLERLTSRALLMMMKEGIIKHPMDFISKYMGPEWEKLPNKDIGDMSKDEYLGRVMKVRYNSLCAATCELKPIGCWPLIIADLLGALESKHLISDSLGPSLVSIHPQEPIVAINYGNVLEMKQRFRWAKTSLQLRLTLTAPQSSKAKILKIIIERLGQFLVVMEALEKFKEWYDKAKAEIERLRAEWEWRNLEPLRGAEDHVDAFERNRDWISRTC